MKLQETGSGDEASLPGERFWQHAERQLGAHELVIDRPAGSTHSRLPHVRCPLDDGYLAGTRAIDGGGVDAWRGSIATNRVTGVIITIEMFRRDAEVKLLVGCTEEEARQALAIHGQGSQAALLLLRPAAGRA